jgi:hypothetical protein
MEQALRHGERPGADDRMIEPLRVDNPRRAFTYA